MALLSKIDPTNFEISIYSPQDETLIPSYDIDTFLSSSSHIEFFVYDLNNNLLNQKYNYKSYSVENDGKSAANGNRISNFNISPIEDLSKSGYGKGKYIAYYNFLSNEIGDINSPLFISEISSDRTELRLDSNILSPSQLSDLTDDFIEKREESDYFLDFYLNFGQNVLIIANNIKLEDEDSNNPTILIKLYDPLPSNFLLKSQPWIVTTLNEPEAFSVDFPSTPDPIQDFEYLQGPNYNIPLKNKINNSSQNLSYNDLISSAPTSSQDQINSLLEESSINISVDYTDFNNFIHFSSAQTRIENFFYKANLIETYASESKILTSISSSSTSKTIIENKISNIIKNFDKFEYFMYYDSGSSITFPKSNLEPPYALYSTTSSQALNWYGSLNEGSVYYGGQLLSSSNYDNANKDQLLQSIPEYLREDSANQPYELFVDMVAQYYDNVWLYTKDITQKYNADNRLDSGISKDLVSDAIKDFGLKLYQNNFSSDELYTAFLGMTPEGSLFPFPEITGSLPVPTGFEFVDTMISASNDVISMDDTNKSLYKRLYHNIPYLLNTKGTITGLRALITSYGIPDTILKISEFGGKDKVNENDWDLYFNKFNYAFNTTGSNFISSSFEANNSFDVSNNRPSSVELRFKAEKFPPTNLSQSLWTLYYPGSSEYSDLTIEYSGSGLDSGSIVNDSGSYSGSIKDPYYQYATLKYYPDISTPSSTASVYLPIFDEGWWSVIVGFDESIDTYTLRAANKIYNGNDGTSIGYISSSVIVDGNAEVWENSEISYFATSSLFPGFSGSLQEIRYYNQELSESVFKDYVMNPLSTEGNGINTSPDQLIFRAALGSELDTTTTSSIHPKVTGSWITTSSFRDDTSIFHFSGSPSYDTNTEYYFLDQFPAGIKNRITDKIRYENSTIPSGSVLSPIRSLSQTTEASASYTDSINYLEVAFSPQNQINDDIISQIGYFNIGDYIGDPRQRSSSAQIYPELNALNEDYFEKYYQNYNLVDFVRLIKFFDNSLFKMIKDFIPVRTSLASGLVIKQHLLERNKYPEPQVTHSFEQYSGSINTAFISGGAAGSFNPFNVNYEFYSTSSIVITEFDYYGYVRVIPDPFSEDSSTMNILDGSIFTDAPNLEWFNRFVSASYDETPNLWVNIQNGATEIVDAFNSGSSTSDRARVDNINLSSSLVTLSSGYTVGPLGAAPLTPTITFFTSSTDPSTTFHSSSIETTVSESYYYDNTYQFNVTQSWNVTTPSLSGSVTTQHSSQDEFYNGELSGSTLIITNGELNEGCDQFKFINPKGGNYGIRSYESTSDNFDDFMNSQNRTLDGFIQTWYQDNTSTPLPPPNPSVDS